ncbi:YceI family protein [Euzebyella saccharophila]|uniref:YceI family protein n=1 Tax=Euzebyella saccharophila TaxID=679664 RepID=A0ABV8JRM9_9FLAO|nr:YceI family protein [Euzebyella saccharophila]
MKRFLVILFVLIGCQPSLWGQEIRVQSAEITFHFTSKDVKGSIGGFNSSSIIDLGNLTESKFSGSVQVETLKTGNFIRDWSLKGGKYFDADAYPSILFKSTKISGNMVDTFQVTGNLTLKGKTKPITFTFTRKDNRLIGLASLFTSDFGIQIKDEREENEVDVTIVLNF